MYKKYSSTIQKKSENMNNTTTFSIKIEEDVGRRDVKTQKLCEQGREINVGPKIKHTSSI